MISRQGVGGHDYVWLMKEYEEDEHRKEYDDSFWLYVWNTQCDEQSSFEDIYLYTKR